MEREKLKALQERSSESGFTPQSGAQLLDWLQTFAATVRQRAQDLTSELDKLVDHTSSVEQELQNTFNSFRLLSNTQFIENRVYEEDETAPPQSESKQQPRPESYEDEIVPRYREAVTLAWNAHDRVLKSSPFRETKQKRLPYIIGTDDFMRDPFCGLSDAQQAPSTSDVRTYDSEAEKDGASMAAQMLGAGIVSEHEWSEPESSSSGEQDNKEPAVSAARDFKAMLEAALRGSYIPYEDGPSSSTSLMDSRNGFGNDHGFGEDETIAGGVDLASESGREAEKDGAPFNDILGKIAREAGPASRRSFDGSSSWSGASDDDESFEAEPAPVQAIANGSSTSSAKLHPGSNSADDDDPVTGNGATPNHSSVTEAGAGAGEAHQAHVEEASSSGKLQSEEFQRSGAGPTSSFRPKSLLFEDEEPRPAPTPKSSVSFPEKGVLRSTTLSTLLFGDEDEDDDEAALFGPVKKK